MTINLKNQPLERLRLLVDSTVGIRLDILKTKLASSQNNPDDLLRKERYLNISLARATETSVIPLIVKKDCNKNDIQAAIDIYISNNIESFDPINWEMFDLFFIKNETTIISTARSELVVNICSN